MAATALRDQEERSVQVNRKELIETLQKNREKPIADYELAKTGYRKVLLDKITMAFNDAESLLKRKREELLRWAKTLSNDELSRTSDRFTLLNAIHLEMSVPRCYAKEYDAAIDIAKWDVRDTLELSYAEFQCFVRDQWDWKSGFEAISMMYTNR